jgi:hypothetical protein
MLKKLILHIAILFYFAVLNANSTHQYSEPDPIVFRIETPEIDYNLRKKPLQMRTGSLSMLNK